MMFTRRAVLATLPVFAALPARAASRRRIRVLAAASLSGVLDGIGREYARATQIDVAFSFAGSMILAKQIEASSGADMFLSADELSMDYLEARGLIDKSSRVDLLGNRLVLIAPKNSTAALTIAPGFALGEALKGGRLALANTETVPAGRYAKAALQSLGVWDGLARRLAEGEDVRAALAYVARGEAPFGIVYETDAKADAAVRTIATFPEGSHPHIRYPAAIVGGAAPEAADFLAYLKGPFARTAFEGAGFQVLN